MSTGPAVSIVLPCFNEGHRIAASIAMLESWFGDEAEILVIDDGSVDDTSAQAEAGAASRSRVRVHRMTRHRGKGGALRAAIPLLRTERVVFVDADLAFGRESIRRAIEALDLAEMAAGNRRHQNSRYSVPVRHFGFLYRRHLMGLMFNALVRAVAGVTQRDTQCGLKAYRRSSLDRIAPALSLDGFALDVEILLVARALDLRVADVPVEVRYETAKSSVRLLASGWAMASDIVRLGLGRLRGRYAPERLRALSGTSAWRANG